MVMTTTQLVRWLRKKQKAATWKNIPQPATHGGPTAEAQRATEVSRLREQLTLLRTSRRSIAHLDTVSGETQQRLREENARATAAVEQRLRELGAGGLVGAIKAALRTLG